METQTRQANLAVTTTRHKLVLDKPQANWDFAAAEDAILRTQRVGKGSVELCRPMNVRGKGQRNTAGMTERSVKRTGCVKEGSQHTGLTEPST